MPKVLQFGVITFKNLNKHRKKKKTLDGFLIQVMCSKNTTKCTYNMSQTLYAKNQMANNIVYKGHVFKLDQQQ
jgi:hypothetical protein